MIGVLATASMLLGAGSLAGSWASARWSQPPSANLIDIRVKDDNTLTLDIYAQSDSHDLALDNLEMGDSAIRSHIEDTIFFASDDATLRISLLRSGYVELIDPDLASETEQAAQENAREALRGLWGSPAPDRQNLPAESPRDVIGDRMGQLVKFVKDRAAALGGLLFAGGFVVWACQAAVQKRHERKVEALVIGLPAVGKSAFVEAWRDNSVSPGDMLGLAPTIVKSTATHGRPIVAGRYELYPTVTDTPGSKPGVALDLMLRRRRRPFRKHILVLVLSPTTSFHGTAFDEKFIRIQEGFVSSFVEALLTAKKVRKPALLLVYVSKFDLYSHAAPRDSSSRATLATITDAFKPHLGALRQTCERERIPFREVYGSSVKRWGFAEVGEEIKVALYS